MSYAPVQTYLQSRLAPLSTVLIFLRAGADRSLEPSTTTLSPKSRFCSGDVRVLLRGPRSVRATSASGLSDMRWSEASRPFDYHAR